jgi:hypothetical protein
MTQPEEKTFTQAEVDAVAAAARKRERELLTAKYGDYDDLKNKAAAADKDKTQLEKLLGEVQGLTDRAEKAEAATLRADVARELGLSDRQARRLHGKTREELLADGREMAEDFKMAKDANGKEGDPAAAPPANEPPAAREPARRRPVEDLRSGAPMTGAAPEEMNPLKLAELIPRA